MRVLLIVAAGNSSRFGGYPKVFYDFGGFTNLDNTVKKAQEVFDKIYLGVNQRVFNEFKDKVKDCIMFPIISGQGDAHSLLKCLRYIRKQNSKLNNITVCWGDAFFVDSMPFIQLLEHSDDSKVLVACSKDAKPYAWFDLNSNNEIIKSHFAKTDGFIDSGIHDQSLFEFNIDFAIKYLNDYRIKCGIEDNNDETKNSVNEMKLLNSFMYLNDIGMPALCCFIDSNKVLAFNTIDDCNELKKII